MADEVADVALSAVTGGWQPEEVAAALVELADHMIMGIIATHDLERDISFLRKLK